MENMSRLQVIKSHSLPDHMGFGRLDPGSVSISPRETYAEYITEGDLVYTVWMGAEGARVEEFHQGKSLGASQHSTLEEAFFRLGTLYKPMLHPRLLDAINGMLKRKLNVEVWLPAKASYLFFPSGLLFTLYLPITGLNRAGWEALRDWEEQKGDTSLLHPRGLVQHEPKLASLLKERFSQYVEYVKLLPALFELNGTIELLHENDVLLPGGSPSLVITV